MKNRVAVVGRPNVGKSTLVNRLVGKRETIVEEKSGVTRDRRTLTVNWKENSFEIIDTGGWTSYSKTKTRSSTKANKFSKYDEAIEKSLNIKKDDVINANDTPLDEKISRQSEMAIEEADIVLLVVDCTTGVTQEDEDIANIVKKSKKPTFVIANKADNDTKIAESWEFLSLGLGNPYPVSAVHGIGTGDLLDVVVENLPHEFEDNESETDGSFRVAIAGRPNVGKSTLFNKLIGSERVIVHDMAGTTRDPVDTSVETEFGLLTFVDTAGLKRQARQADATEYYSSLRSFAAIDRADCVLFMVDGEEGVTHFDMRLLERIDAAGCALVILMNKWDLLDTDQRLETLAKAKRELGFVDYAPIVTLSALSGRKLDKIIPALFEARDAYEQRIPTGELNKVIHAAQISHPHPMRRNKRVRIFYATQGASNPPTITLFTSQALDESYMRYLENVLRESFDLGSTAIKLRFKRKSG